MFGMGFTEILIIAIIAILFLGPDKLPSTMVEIAKFFRSVKNTVGTMKESFEEELQVKSVKEEALAYKKELLDASQKVKSATDIKSMASKLTTLEDDSFMDDVFSSDSSKEQTPKSQTKPDEITLEKKKIGQNTNKEENKDV